MVHVDLLPTCPPSAQNITMISLQKAHWMSKKYNIKHKAELYQIGMIVKKNTSRGQEIWIHCYFWAKILLFFLSASLRTFVQNQVIRVVQPLWFSYTRTQKYFLLPHCSLYRGRHRCRIATGVATCYIESSDKKYYNLPYHTKLSHTIGAARFKHGMVIYVPGLLQDTMDSYRISRPIRRTMIFC